MSESTEHRVPELPLVELPLVLKGTIGEMVAFLEQMAQEEQEGKGMGDGSRVHRISC